MSSDGSSDAASARGGKPGWLRDPIVWIAVLALAVRLVAVVAVADWQQPPSDKVLRYDAIAMSLLDGDGFSIDGNPTATSGPLYPLLLAFVYGVFGYSATAIRTVLAVIDVGHCLLWVLIARECLGPRSGLLTGVLIAACPYFVYLVVTAGSDSLFLALHAVFVLLLVRSMQMPTHGGFLRTGVALGLATLCRAVSLLMPLFLVPFVLLRCRRSLARGAIAVMLIAIGFAITLTPWTIRNFARFQRFVPVQTLGGYHLYLASGDPGQDTFIRESTDLTHGARGGVAADGDYYRSALNRIIRDPVQFARLMGTRLVKMWYVTHSGRAPWALGVTNLLLLSLAATGVVLSRRRWESLLVLYAVIAYYVCLHSALFAIFRYLMPVVPALLVFASVALLMAFDRARGVVRGER